MTTMTITADFALPRSVAYHAPWLRGWLDRLSHALAVHARLDRRRRLRKAGRMDAPGWMLALPQSRHGG